MTAQAKQDAINSARERLKELRWQRVKLDADVVMWETILEALQVEQQQEEK